MVRQRQLLAIEKTDEGQQVLALGHDKFDLAMVRAKHAEPRNNSWVEKYQLDTQHARLAITNGARLYVAPATPVSNAHTRRGNLRFFRAVDNGIPHFKF